MSVHCFSGLLFNIQAVVFKTNPLDNHIKNVTVSFLLCCSSCLNCKHLLKKFASEPKSFSSLLLSLANRNDNIWRSHIYKGHTCWYSVVYKSRSHLNSITILNSKQNWQFNLHLRCFLEIL